MKSIKRNGTICIIVVLCCFSLLSTGLMQPIQTANAMSAKSDLLDMSDVSFDLQQVSETMFIVSAGDVSITVEVLGEDNYRMSTVLDNGTIMSFEISTELRLVSNARLEGSSENVELLEKVVLVNGIELPMPNNQYEPLKTRAPYNKYWWDWILFEEGYQTSPYIDIAYPHPNRAFYNISRCDIWSREGTQLIHNQIDNATTAAFLSLGPNIAEVAICAGVGALIGGFIGGGNGAAIGLVVGVVFSGFTVGLGSAPFVDEAGCIWWWVNKNFVNWLNNNGSYILSQPIPEAVVLAELALNGYIRIGSITLYEGYYVNIGNPAAVPPYYAVAITTSATGNAYVNNPNNIWGPPDGSYAFLNSGSFGNKAEIIVTFSYVPISGNLYLRCYTPSASGANLKVFVGNQYGAWTQVVNTNLYPANSVMNINCGYVSNFVNVSIVALHEYNGYPSYLYVDAVWVQ